MSVTVDSAGGHDVSPHLQIICTRMYLQEYKIPRRVCILNHSGFSLIPQGTCCLDTGGTTILYIFSQIHFRMEKTTQTIEFKNKYVRAAELLYRRQILKSVQLGLTV